MGEVLHGQFGEIAEPMMALAAGAESLSFEMPVTPLVGLAEVVQISPYETSDTSYWSPTEHLSFLSSIREEAHRAATDIMDKRRALLFEGDFEDIPLEIDALGTAAKKAVVAKRFGKESPEHAVVDRGHLLDCLRKFAEAESANRYEYFEPTEQEYDRATDMMFADGLSVDEMLENGLTPIGEKEEQQRRINDYVIQAERKALHRSDASEEVVSVHISPCAQWALDAYAENPRGLFGNYVPALDKMMIGLSKSSSATQKMHEERIAVPGFFYPPEVVAAAYKRFEAIDQASPSLSRDEIHSTHAVISREKVSDIFGFMGVLDEVASEQSGKKIFMGEVVSDDHPRDYGLVVEESRARRQSQHESAKALKDYTDELYADGVDPARAGVLVERFVQQRILDKAVQNPALAADAFDETTARGFEQAQALKSVGRLQEAEAIIETTRRQAPPAMSCGAGSCGLEALRSGSKEEAKIKEQLEAKAGETILRDTARACGNCGRVGQVHYAFTSSSVKKYCGKCDTVDFKKRKKQPEMNDASTTFTLYSSKDKMAYTLAS